MSSSTERARIAVVDDEAAIGEILGAILARDGHEVAVFTDPRVALAELSRAPAEIVIHDLRMPGLSGLDLLRALKATNPSPICIVITAFGTWSDAVEAMRAGAYGYIKKPFDNDTIRLTVDRALAMKRLAARGDSDESSLRQVIGNSAAMREVESMVRRVAGTDSTVLITGENGTGKERLARAIHHLSLRKHGPFVPLNCGGLSESLLEDELFGHVKGAFTGAINERHGYFETAADGTLFMDEIGEMPPSIQVKVLRVLEDRTVVPVGASVGRRINVRIIAATNRDLAAEVAAGRFRTDLYYRFNVIPVHLPALRERREDIPVLAGHFLAGFAARANKPARAFSSEAMEWLMGSDWPGNIRELQNTIERAVTLSEGDVVTLADVRGRSSVRMKPSSGDAPLALPLVTPDGIDLEAILARIERSYLDQALEQAGGNQTRAAALLGMTFRSFRYRLNKVREARSPSE